MRGRWRHGFSPAERHSVHCRRPVHAFTATAASTFGAPSKIPAAGEAVTVIITQDGTGGWAISWNAAYVFPSAWSNTGNTAGKKSVARFVSDGSKLIAQGANSWY